VSLDNLSYSGFVSYTAGVRFQGAGDAAAWRGTCIHSSAAQVKEH
jgi:hypothetical protein